MCGVLTLSASGMCMQVSKGVGEFFSEPLQSQGVKAVVDAMQAHLQVANVQIMACSALHGLTKALSIAGRQAAAEAGAIEAVLNAMQAHQQNRLVQRLGFWRERGQNTQATCSQSRSARGFAS